MCHLMQARSQLKKQKKKNPSKINTENLPKNGEIFVASELFGLVGWVLVAGSGLIGLEALNQSFLSVGNIFRLIGPDV